MTIGEVSSRLGLSGIEEGFARDWADSERSFPGLPLPFLTESFIRENAPLASFTDGAIEHLRRVAERTKRNEPLSRLLWHEHRIYTGIDTADGPVKTRRLFRRRGARATISFLDEEYDPGGFPDLTPSLGTEAAVLNILIALSALPNTRWFYETRHLPEAILRSTLSDLAVWYRYYSDRLGYGGINLGTLSWLRFHLQGRLFRLGRLQFMQGSFPRDLTVYRSARTGVVQVLADGGMTVDSHGLLILGEDKTPAGGSWTTRRWCCTDAVHGNPVLSSGRIGREEAALDMEEYRPVLEEHTSVLEIHVPEDGPMSPDLCADSVAQAAEFFPSYFPERGYRAFTCESWFLGQELLDLLDPGSNIVRFARELFLYPCFGGQEDTLARIYGPRYRELGPARWARTSTLERRVADHIGNGGILRRGGGFILKEDSPWDSTVSRG